MNWLQECDERPPAGMPNLEVASAELFRTLIESFSDYIWQIDAAGRYVYVSAGVTRTLGYEPAELRGQTPFAIMSADEARRVAAVFGPIAAQHQPFSLLENTVLHKEGREVVLETSGRPLFDQQGTFRGYFGIDRDVTRRRRVERELADSERKFRGIFDAEADGILVADCDARRLVLANRAIREMLGYEPAELREFELERLHPASAWPAVDAHFKRLSAGEKHVSIVAPVKRKDGSDFVATIVASPIVLGGRLHAIGLIRDVTERHRQEQQLREEKEKLKGLVEQNVAGIAIVLDDGAVGYANPFFAALSGRTVAEIVGRPLLDLVPATEKRLVADKLSAQAPATHGLVQLATMLERKDGTTIDVLINASRAIFEGRPASIAIVLDETERKRAELALHASEAKLSIALQMARAAYWEYDITADRFTFNDDFYRILHTTADAAGGYSMSAADYTRRFVHPDDAGIIAGAIRTAIDSATESGYRDIENRIRYADGSEGHMAARYFLDRNAEGRAVRAYGVSQDITLHKRNEETLRRLNRALRTLSAGNSTLVRAEREPEFLQAMCRVLVEVGGYAAATISYAENDEAKTVRPVAWAGGHVDYIQNARISWSDEQRGQGPTGTAIRTGKPAVNADFASNPQVLPWRRDALARGFASSIAFPLQEDAKVFGALTIYTQQHDMFDPEEVKLLTEFSEDLAFGIVALRTRLAREEAVTRLREAMTSTVLALAATLERRDPYTAGHQRNVAKLSSAIASKVGIPPSDQAGIYLAAVIHDIGKIQVPGEILSKPGKLTDLEFAIIKTHAQAGYEIVKGIDFPWPVAEMILQHHERLDGSGYPNGLKADAILPGARILAVADVVEAMMAHRPYRAGLGVEAALAEVRQGRGVRYDAAAVDACVALIQDGFTF